MSDPLSLIRNAKIAGDTIVSANGFYSLASVQLPELTSTSFRRTLRGNDYCYTLKDIAVFLENVHETVAVYRKKAVEARATAVVEQDRQTLKDYLTGVIDTAPQIDVSLAANYVLPTQSAAVVAGGSATSRHAPNSADTTMNAVPSNTTAAVATTAQNTAAHAQIPSDTQASATASASAAATGATAGTAANHAANPNASSASRKRKGGPGSSSSSSGAAAVGTKTGLDREAQALDREFLASDRQVLAALRADEIPAHTRSTVLNAPNMDFSLVLKLFNDRVLRPKGGVGGGGVGAGTMQGSSSQPPLKGKRVGTTNATTTTASGVGGAKSDKHAAAAAKAAALASAAAAAVAGQGASAGGSSSATANRMYPIIIVPSAITSKITMLNAKEFLLQGVYHTVEEKRKAGAPKERELLLVRELLDGARRVYKVIDDATKLGSHDWGRVVAVFATGQEWQFKGWKYSEPVVLFQKVLGFHLMQEATVLNPNIQSWNCNILKINEFKQHVNAGASKNFWILLDDYIRLHRPHLHPENIMKAAAAAAQQQQQQQQAAAAQRKQKHHHQHHKSSSGKPSSKAQLAK